MSPQFSPEMAENGWRVIAHPYIFALGDTASLTAWTLYNRHQASFGTCYIVVRAYSLERQNAGRTQAGLCHASSLFYFICLFIYLFQTLCAYVRQKAVIEQ